MDKQTPTQNQNKQGKNTLRKTMSIAQSSKAKSFLDKSDCIQTPTQIATQSMKGCGVVTNRYLFWICGGRMINKRRYCKICKSKILAYRTAWADELGNLHKWKSDSYTGFSYDMQERISELTSALKILDGDKK